MSKDFRERFDVKLRYLDCPHCEGVPDLMELYLLQPITLEKAGEKLPVCTRLGGFRFARQEVVIRIFRVELLDDVHEQRRNRDNSGRCLRLRRSYMEIGRSFSLVIDALDSLVDIDGLVRKGNVLHLESAKLADPNAGKQRNQNTRRFSVQVHVDALNKGLFLIFGERVDFLDTQLFRVLNQVPIQQWNSPLFIGELHCKPENENNIPYGLYGKPSRVVKPTGIVEIRNVALNVRFGDAANLTLAEVRDQMIFGNQREAGVG